jgi:hypothetical protein
MSCAQLRFRPPRLHRSRPAPPCGTPPHCSTATQTPHRAIGEAGPQTNPPSGPLLPPGYAFCVPGDLAPTYVNAVATCPEGYQLDENGL